MVKTCLLSALGIVLAAGFLSAGDNELVLAQKRLQMVREIESDVRETSFRIGKKNLDPNVMKAMTQTPRHKFVPEKLEPNAYDNRPLPIGHGQTISQPYIVALMTDLLSVSQSAKVLEIGTGSGYQAAVLSRLVRKVISVEIIEPLHLSATKKLKKLGYGNVQTYLGDGYYGWKEEAPFDGIIVTAAASHVPPPLVAQLKPGGKMVIPVGSRFFVQQLTIIEKRADGTVTTRQVLPVRFVPLTGKR